MKKSSSQTRILNNQNDSDYFQFENQDRFNSKTRQNRHNPKPNRELSRNSINQQQSFESLQLSTQQVATSRQGQSNSRNSPPKLKKSSSVQSKPKRQDFSERQLQDMFEQNQFSNIIKSGSNNLKSKGINTLNCLQQSTNNNRIISHQNIPSSVSNNLQYQSVREILFQHSQKRSKERQVVNQDSKLKQKYFKMFKQYVKLKLKVRIFLSDEIENLNREFDKLLVQNKYLLNENQKYKKYCETSLLETHVNTKRTFQLGQTLMKIYENNKKTNQSDFLKEFKIIKKREQAILSLIKLKTNTSKLKAFLKWRGLLNELKRPRSNLTTISQITMKPPKHQNNQTPNDLSTCPNSMIKTQQSSGFISKSQSQKRFDNGSNENTQFVQDMSALHMFPQRLSLNSRQDSQKRRSVSSKRDKSQNSDKSCCVITTKQQNRCHSRQSMMSDDKNPGTRDTSQNQIQKDQPKRFFDQKMLQKLQRIQQLDKETSKDRKSVPQQTTEQLFKPAKTLNILEKHKYQQSSHKEMRQSIKFERSISNLKGASSNNVSSSQLSIQGILQKLGNQPQSNISSSRHGETHQSNNKTFEPTEMDLSSTNLIISSQMNHLQNFSISEYNMESMICQMKNVINNQKAEFQKPKAKDLKERLKESIFTPQYNHCNRVLSAKQVGANKVEDYELKRAIIDKENINTNNIGVKPQNYLQNNNRGLQMYDYDFMTSDESSRTSNNSNKVPIRSLKRQESFQSITSSESSYQIINSNRLIKK